MAKDVVTKVEENAAPAPAVVRTKFQVMRIGDVDTATSAPGETVTFKAVSRETADGKFENLGFAVGEPVGSMTIEVTNVDLIGHFEAGEMYYVDIKAAPKQ